MTGGLAAVVVSSQTLCRNGGLGVMGNSSRIERCKIYTVLSLSVMKFRSLNFEIKSFHMNFICFLRNVSMMDQVIKIEANPESPTY